MKAALLNLLKRFPRLKALLKRVRGALAPSGSVSSHYVEIKGAQADDEAHRLRGAWQDGSLPAKQRALVDQQLADYRKGAPIDVFDVMVRALRALPQTDKPLTVLEVGCSSGHYAEVLQIAGLPVAYAGCDYSGAFIDLARKTYPQLQFDVEDATSLSYEANAFDVVISGCCLLHIPDYAAAVAETARVARRYAVFHRTPMVIGEPTKVFRKLAYGVETVEIHFNEPEFIALLAVNGLELIGTYTLDEAIRDGVGTANRTYVCHKKTR